jgi:hypothetical protein
MTRPSRHTLRQLGNELANAWTLGAITDLFEDERVALGPQEAHGVFGGQRRGLMEQYLSTMDLDTETDQRKLYRILDRVLADAAERSPEAEASLVKLEGMLRKDGIAVDSVTHQTAPHGVRLQEEALAALEDASAIREHLRRLDDNIDSDPRLAVSVAKDLVESTAKLVLRHRDVPYNDRKDDLPALVFRAQEALGLSAAKVDGENPEATQLKTILGALAALTQGVTELRNRVGVGHGRESVPTWVRPRHARLAAGAAHVWCQLLLETLDDPEAPWRSKATRFT